MMLTNDYENFQMKSIESTQDMSTWFMDIDPIYIYMDIVNMTCSLGRKFSEKELIHVSFAPLCLLRI